MNEEEAIDQAKALRSLLLYGIVPGWLVPGFLDYLYHRRSRIEKTSGTHESMIHAFQMSSTGVGVTAALFLEIDASVIVLLFTVFVVHQLLTLWDVDYANDLREVVPNEQHCHSFLEVLPFTALAFVGVIRTRQVLSLFGLGKEKPRWDLRWKQEGRLSPAYIAGILGAVGGLIVLPYAEELRRCYRVDRTIRSHKNDPIEEPSN